MDAATNYDEVSLHSGGQDSDFNRSSISVMTSRDSESFGEIITRFEWDIACLCEKLTNLNFLSMHVETKERDFEVFVSDTDPDLVINALEYALLSGFLDSEVKLLEAYISELQMEIVNVTESLFSRKHFGESLTRMVDMLHDSEKSLELLKEDVLEIKTQSANFEKNLVRLSGGEDHTESPYSIEQVELNDKMKINMHNAEHQRHVLKMLDKYLEREIDLEKRMSELTLSEETLAMRLRLSEQEVVYAEVEAETTIEKFYETDHTSKLFLEISKELISKIKMLQLNLTGSQGKIQTESMKDRSIFSESNADNKKELDLVKIKVKSLETSLHQMEDTKKASARNINHCCKFISDMVMQMTLERERIQKQILSLKQENKILINHSKKTDFTTAKTDALSSNFEVEKSCNETARDIDARQLKTKDILLVLFILIIPLFGVLLSTSSFISPAWVNISWSVCKFRCIPT